MSCRIFVVALVLSTCLVGYGQERYFKLCEAKANWLTRKVSPLSISIRGGECKGCEDLRGCTTFDGSIQVRGGRSQNSSVLKQLRFPLLTEITGHLLVTFIIPENMDNLKDIFPKLAVIRGRPSNLFFAYSLIIYNNKGLRYINLPSLTTILHGSVRIENNIYLCYVDTIRWSSIMKGTSAGEELVIDQKDNGCVEGCFKQRCVAPAGHGASGYEYCWAEGTSSDPACQKLCDGACGDRGCVDDTNKECCHKECLGGCSKPGSPQYCHACSHLRNPDGTCVQNCDRGMFKVENFKCVAKCPCNYYTLESKGLCVKACPAGYEASDSRSTCSTKCVECVDQTCPKVCGTTNVVFDTKTKLPDFKDCIIIDGNLELKIPGSAGIGKLLEESFGKVEVVQGYILVRSSGSLLSLNFLKNLKTIDPKEPYNKKYALAVFDNPKLEALWPSQHNLTITKGGIMIHLNPYLCPSKIKEELKWNHTGQSNVGRPVDISDSTNGNSAACNVSKIDMKVREPAKRPPGVRCSSICVEVKWTEVLPKNDYRNVLFYTVSYREAPNRNITEYEDVDACSDENQGVWTKKDVSVDTPPVGGKSRDIPAYIEKLKPFTLYAFQVEAVVLENEGARSDLVFFQTKEQVPSQPVGLEVHYLNSSSLNIKWEVPLFPNGIITKYIVTYQRSSFTRWKEQMESLNWCERQFYISKNDDKESEGTTDSGGDGEGSCMRNITCDCDKDKEEELKPEKEAALFAKLFQDRIYKSVFIKNDNDNDKVSTTSTPTTAARTTVPSSNNSVAHNCSSGGQGPECGPLTGPTDAGVTTKDGATTPDQPPTTRPTEDPFKPVEIHVNGSLTSLDVHDLGHFADYTVTVCACTKAGCASGPACALAKGRTDKRERADDLEHPIEVTTDNKSPSFTVSWRPPPSPNAVVLKYEVQITRDTNDPAFHCSRGSITSFRQELVARGNYSASVRAITPAGNGSWSKPRFFRLFQAEVDDTETSTVQAEAAPVGMVVGASLAASTVFVLACGLVVWYIARKRYGEKQVPGVLYASVNPEYMNSADVYIADEWEIPREQIKLTKELGNGSFGMVYEGEATNLVEGQMSCRVAVKTVSENASTRDRLDFLQEASIMKAFACDHVVRLLGVVSEGQPTLVVMELMEHGDLKNFLRSRRPEENGMPPPTLPEMLHMSAEIADGMAYLAARKFVHRDLAARNCMVNANFTVKIGDFGMTRDIYETDYYRKGGKGLLPVRWMGPESLKDGVFTSASDVWSYGVVLWEMATLASQPYPGKSNEDVLKHVVNGGVMEKPEDCPDQLYDLMALCWQHQPKDRPTFIYIVRLLEAHLSDRFRETSFYHSLQRENLEGLLHNHYDKHRHRTGTLESSA